MQAGGDGASRRGSHALICTLILLPGLAERVVVIDSPMLGFSSTEIADRLEAGKSVRYLVPDAVLAYIQNHRLYQNGS